MRFALEVVHCVRRQVGPDFPLGFRLVGEEMPLGSGLRLKDTVEIAGRLAEAGIDMLHVSVGNVGPSLGLVVAPMAMDRGFNVYAAAAVKRTVDIPVIAVGRINDVHLAAQIVRDGHADLVAMGRASWPIPSSRARLRRDAWTRSATALAAPMPARGPIATATTTRSWAGSWAGRWSRPACPGTSGWSAAA